MRNLQQQWDLTRAHSQRAAEGKLNQRDGLPSVLGSVTWQGPKARRVWCYLCCLGHHTMLPRTGSSHGLKQYSLLQLPLMPKHHKANTFCITLDKLSAILIWWFAQLSLQIYLFSFNCGHDSVIASIFADIRESVPHLFSNMLILLKR